MTAADRVIRAREVISEIVVCLRGFRRWESQYSHRLVVQDRNRLVNRVVSGRRWTSTREADGSCVVRWWLWIVKGVRESRSPNTGHQPPENMVESELPELPVTKIAGDDAKGVLPREKWGDEFPEPDLRLTVYRTDEDRNYGNI